MSLTEVECKICGGSSVFVFKKNVLFKYNVSYYRCTNCGFMQTEDPYWIQEAYSAPLSATDTGLIMRPMNFSRVAEGIIMKWFDPFGTFLDYGGGNGVFVRMMRDKGFNFFRYDKYAGNVYSIGFDLSDIADKTERFELMTSIEAIEHFENPLEEISGMLSLSDNLLFTTYINDTVPSDLLKDWWYLGEYNGQHISFYSAKSLKIIADRYNCYYYTNNIDTHLFSKKKIAGIEFTQKYNLNSCHKLRNKLVGGIDKIYNAMVNPMIHFPPSLTQKDIEYVKKLMIDQCNNVLPKDSK